MADGVSAQLSLPDRARAVAHIASEFADESEQLGQLAEPVVAALHENKLFGMWVPESVGGAELDPTDSLQVIENMSYGDPSAGWVLMAASLAIGTGAAYLEKSAVDELFGGDRYPVIAGQGTRPGNAVPHKDGFLLSGSWSFASGIKHGTHIHTLGVIETTGEPRIFVLPVEQAELIDNWDVMGLRATGSIDYRIDGAFVPEAYTHFAVTDVPKQGGYLYRVGIVGFACMCHSGWACGIGRRVLDELAANVRARGGLKNPQGASDSFQQGYAKAEGTYRAARALVYETWNDVQETLKRGDRLTTRQHTLMRLAMAHVTWASHEVTSFVYKHSGTNALRAGTIQRLFRDMHAGTQHLVASPPVFGAIGRELAELVDGAQWQFLDLVGARSE